MGVFLFSMKMLKKEYQKVLVYAFTFMFTIAACFVFFNIVNNPLLTTEGVTTGGATIQQISMPVSTGFAFLVLVFCSAMIIFANHFMLMQKTQEMAIMSMSGLSYLKLTLYLFYQNIFITICVLPFGLLLGYGGSVLIQSIIYQALSIHVSIYQVSGVTFIHTAATICVMILTLLVYSSGYVYRHDIQYLLSSQSTNHTEDTRILRFPSWIYMIIYVFGLSLMIFSSYTIYIFIFPSVVGSFGINGILKYILPDLSIKLKQKYFITKQLLLISISHFSTALKKSMFLVSLYNISTVVIIALLIAQQNKIQEFIIVIVGFIIIFILLSLGILYKYLIEIMDRRISYYNLHNLGYTKKKIQKIIALEVFLYYFIITMVPLTYVIVMLTRCYIHQDISFIFMIIILLTEILVPSCIAVMTYHQYHKIIQKSLQEGVHYE